jgi:arsenate reductase (thioredoxin)
MSETQTDAWMTETLDALERDLAGLAERDVLERFLVEAATHLRGRGTTEDTMRGLAARMARERAEALALAEGRTERTAPEVLFVCVHNAGRSQMAAAYTKALGGGQVQVRSAGSAPKNEISENVARVMAEAGLDVSEAFPKPLTDEAVRAADVVITMGCGDECPFYPGKRYEDWQVDDPAGQPIEVVRTIRDDVRARVEALLADLGVPVAGAS